MANWLCFFRASAEWKLRKPLGLLYLGWDSRVTKLALFLHFLRLTGGRGRPLTVGCDKFAFSCRMVVNCFAVNGLGAERQRTGNVALSRGGQGGSAQVEGSWNAIAYIFRLERSRGSLGCRGAVLVSY